MIAYLSLLLAYKAVFALERPTKPAPTDPDIDHWEGNLRRHVDYYEAPTDVYDRPMSSMMHNVPRHGDDFGNLLHHGHKQTGSSQKNNYI